MVIDLFILGGLGLILKTLSNGWQLRSFRPHLTKQMALDIGGMVLIHSSLFWVALQYGVLGRYLLFWIILERMIGIIVQMRDHLEHYGCWGKQKNYLLTQLYATRNLKVNKLTQWLMGGLPYHSVHHAFPQIPFYQLPEAFNRIQQQLLDYQYSPLVLGEGYFKETLLLNNNPTVIDPSETTMKAIKT
jgi:fatty acid desaturase